MLEIDKSTVDFLVTEGMVEEVRHVLENIYPQMDKLSEKIKQAEVKHLIFVACGSPLCACQSAQHLAKRYSSFDVSCYSGMDFVAIPPYVLGKDALVVALSDSGTTQEIIDAVHLAEKRGAMTLAVTKNSDSALAKAGQELIAYEADCIWEVHLLITYKLVLSLMEENKQEAQKILGDLKKLPEVLEALVTGVEEDMKTLAQKAREWSMIYTVSGGNLLPLGYKEGIITMLEFTWTHGCSLNASEFRHGPLEVVEPGVPYVFFIGRDESRNIVQRALKFVSGLSEDVLVFDVKDYCDKLHPALDPFVLFVPLEFFYFYLSLYKDHNPDDRRYYGGLRSY